MKHWIRRFTALLTACMLVFSLTVTAAAASLTFEDAYGTWTYQMEEDGSVTLLKCKTTRKNIVVPATIDGKPVKKLGKHLFQNNDTITGVVIPHGVEEIEKMVFFGCEKLEHVEIPNSVTAIGDKAFSKCEAMEKLYIPASVTELGKKVFEDSANLEVQCAVNSETAAYLKQNPSEVANYTLIKVTYQHADPQPEPGVAPEASGPSVINGKLVTYTFGKTINGKPEFTFVVADSMPDLDLMHYVIKMENGSGFSYQRETVEKLMRNRFQLVSVSRYDGKNTETLAFTQSNSMLNVGISTYEHLDEAGKPQIEVLYNIFVNVRKDAFVPGLPHLFEFNSDNEMLTYSINDQEGAGTMVKDEQGVYTSYSRYEGVSGRYQAKGGAPVVTTNEKGAEFHRFAVEGSCVGISIKRTENREPSGDGFNEVYNQIAAHNAETKTSVNASVQEFIHLDGTKERQNSSLVKYVDGAFAEDRYYIADYDNDNDNDNNVVEAHHQIRSKGETEGTFVISNTTGRVNEAWTVVREELRTNPDGSKSNTLIDIDHQDTNRVFGAEIVVKADSIEEALSKVHQDFPNEVDKRRDYVSYTFVNSVEVQKEEVKVTNMDTGTATSVDTLHKVEVLTNYTFIGDTGKYVGWDWSWHYEYADKTAATDGDAKLYQYVVTEYKCTAKGDSWTKTTTYANAKEPGASTIDFQNTNPASGLTLEQILADYNLYTESYVYDPANSGIDHWKQTGSDNFRIIEDDDGTETVNHNHTDVQTDLTVGIVTEDGQPVGDALVDGRTAEDSNLSSEAKELLDAMPEQKESITDMILGTSELTTADGTVLTQNEVKKDMIALAEDMKEEALKEINYFEQTLADVPDGEELMETVEDVYNGAQLPESNVEGTVDHNHNNNVPVTNIQEPANQPEPSTETGTEPMAEPAAEAVGEV